MKKHTNYKYDLNGNKLGKYDGWSCISTISQQNKDITKTDWYVFISNYVTYSNCQDSIVIIKLGDDADE